MELGDRYLVVQRASIGAKGISNTPGMPTFDEYNAGMGTAVARPMMPMDSSANPDARILLMLNMVTADDLVEDSEYDEILQDIREECGTFGDVEDLKVPRPTKKPKTGWAPGGAPKAEDEAKGVGRVYVKFITPASAQAALQGLAGRSFAGRSIIATLLGDEGNVYFEAPPPPPPDDDDVPDDINDMAMTAA